MGWVCGGRQSRNGWMMNAIEGVPGTKGPFRARQDDNCSNGTSKHNNGGGGKSVSSKAERSATTKSTNTVMGLPLKANLVSKFSSIRTMTQPVLGPTPRCADTQANICPFVPVFPGRQETFVDI